MVLRAPGLPPELTFFSQSAAAETLPQAQMAPQHRQVLAYWEAKRGTRRAPRRVDFDPLDLPRALPNLALWACDGVDDYRCRLAGTDIDNSIGFPLKGVALSEIPCTLLHETKAEFDAVRDRAQGSFAERTMNWAGKPYRYYKHLLLPFVDDAGAVTTFLSILTFHSIADRPRAATIDGTIDEGRAKGAHFPGGLNLSDRSSP